MPWKGPFPTWTPEKIERLKELWAKGYSAGLIAVELRTSRNSVIGKINRLKLEWRPETHLRLGRRNNWPQPPKPAPQPAQLLETEQAVSSQAPVAPHRWVSLLELRPRQCRWPHGDAAPYAFCGATVWEELPYCEQHARAAYPGLRK